MQAVLMAGGKGTRLRPFTAVLPKPLVPVGEISILEMVLRQLRYYGFDEVVICVGHKAELIMAVVGDGKRFGLEVRYHLEDKPLGTVGALPQVEGLKENFLVMNGDICCDLDFSLIHRSHVDHGAAATIGCYQREEQIELGVVKLDMEGGEIVGFEEKPIHHLWVAMGVYALNRRVIDLIPRSQFFGFDSLLHRMLAEKIRIRAFQFRGLWLDIGRPDDYEKLLQEFDDHRLAYLPDGA